MRPALLPLQIFPFNASLRINPGTDLFLCNDTTLRVAFGCSLLAAPGSAPSCCPAAPSPAPAPLCPQSLGTEQRLPRYPAPPLLPVPPAPATATAGEMANMQRCQSREPTPLEMEPKKCPSQYDCSPFVMTFFRTEKIYIKEIKSSYFNNLHNANFKSECCVKSNSC